MPSSLPGLFLRTGLLSCLLLHAPAAWATTFTVDRTDDPDPTTATICDDATLNDCSLRGAVQNANSHAGLDVVVLPASATPYTLTLPFQLGSPDDGNDGDLDITDDVTIEGKGASSTVIDGNGSVSHDRVFQIGPSSSPTVIIRDLTIQNGHATNASSLTPARSGGGIHITDGEVLLDSLRIHANASGNGLTNTILPNSPGGSGACGGGLSVGTGTVTLLNSTIENNAAGKGGNGSAPTAAGGKGGNGGGICVNQGTVAIRNTTIFGNYGGAGGDAAGSANSGDGGDGGGLFLALSVGSAAVTLNNVTVTGNASGIGGDGAAPGSGGGIAHGSGGTLNVGNSLIAGNEVGSGGTGMDCDGTIASAGFNLLGIGTACTFTGTDGVNGDDVGTLAAPLNPFFDPAGLADNGGPTQTIAIQAASPAKDTGDTASCETTDQRGEARPVSGTGVCDKGAFEITACGDGAVQSGETCDDGNTDGGDGCSPSCEIEAGGTAGTTTGSTTGGTGGGTGSGTTTAGNGGDGGGCSLVSFPTPASYQ